ncbi:MAG: ABC transporter substrate-binding protein [Pirellulaceae bacterium]
MLNRIIITNRLGPNLRKWIGVLGYGLVVLCMQFAVSCHAQKDEGPIGSRLIDNIDLIDQEPFDRIYLNEDNDNSEMDIVPLIDVPPKPLPTSGNLVFELMDGSWPKLQVPWDVVVDYKTFEELVLDEAEELIKDGNYSKALRDLLYVKDSREGENPEVENKLQSVLFLDAKNNYDNGNYGIALSLFEDLYERNPRFSIRGITQTSIDLILECYDRNLTQYYEEDDYRSTTQLLKNVNRKYRRAAAPLVEKWNTIFGDEHRRAIDEAKQLIAAGSTRLARMAATKAINLLPENEEGYELYNSVVTGDPIVFVGTSQPALSPNPGRIEDWASRRVGRLTQRRIVEMTGLSEEGGRYDFTNGRIIQLDEQGYHYRLEIDPENDSFAVPPLTAYQLRSILLRYADPDSPVSQKSWTKVLKTVSVTGKNTVDIELRVPFVRPEALMDFPYQIFENNDDDKTGPYVQSEKVDEYITFDVNPAYSKSADSQYPRLVEWQFSSPSDAVDALRKGAVDAVDRVAPSDVSKLRLDPNIEVRSYLVPTVHMLLPNPRNEFVASQIFRSGLMKSIDRQHILYDVLCDGKRIDGSEVIDGPFPIGSDENQQIAYGYNTRIPGVDFSRMIGAVKVEVVRNMVEKNIIAKGDDADPHVNFPEIVIAHPQGDVPKLACLQIQTSWNQIPGLVTRLRELPPGVTVPEDKDYDFLYLELSMTEPLADAEFLFGNEGLVKELSAPIEQMMRQVAVANSWRASSSLRQLHRQILNDVAIIPLWQMREHYAYRRNVRDVGRNLMYLYQFVDRWQIQALERDDSKEQNSDPNP